MRVEVGINAMPEGWRGSIADLYAGQVFEANFITASAAVRVTKLNASGEPRLDPIDIERVLTHGFFPDLVSLKYASLYSEDRDDSADRIPAWKARASARGLARVMAYDLLLPSEIIHGIASGEARLRFEDRKDVY